MADASRLNVELKQLALKDVKLLEVNARFMRHETFQQLVGNIRRDGVLTSTPFAWWDGKQYEVLSGNHRAMAAVEAGIEQAWFLVTHDPLTEDERVAIQLSHNAIAGEDDPAILKRLYEAISEVDLKQYAGLDDKTLELLGSVQPLTLNESSLRYANVSIVFLPDELAEAEEILAAARTAVSGSDAVWVNRWQEYDAFLDSIDTASAAHGVRNTATALMAVLRIFQAHMDDLGEVVAQRDDHEWVPIAAVLGSDRIPASVARELMKRVNREIASGDIQHPYEVVGRMLM